MTAVDFPDEPPVGTIVTAPRARHFWQRDADGWWVVTSDGKTKLAENAPPGRWEKIAGVLVALGGILTVTTEYQVEYRFTDVQTSTADAARKTALTGRLGDFRTRGQITRWAASMRGTNAVEILRVQSQRVTRSAWTDEPIEDLT